MKTTHDFYTEVIGRAYDLDGYFGAQCWDGAMYYSQWLGKPIFHCGLTGYVKDIWHQRKSSGILAHYKEVQKPFQDGDIIVWDECPQTPLSHIAIFRKDNGNGTLIALGQNQGGAGGAFNQRSFTYDGILGGFRPIDTTPKKPAESKPKQTYKPIAKEKERSVYRLYNANTGDHLYTIDHAEAEKAHKAGWKYEGVSWIAPASGDPVYRLISKAGYHHFTADKTEADRLKALGWKLEGTAFRSSGSGVIYRMYNPNSGAHLLTPEGKEHAALSSLGWKCEGIGMYF